MADFASILSPNGTTDWECSVEQTSGERWPVDADALRRAEDPNECPAELLPWLAYQVGVTLWFDDWPEDKKRRAIANFPRLKKLIGTVEGIRGFLDLVDVPLVRAVLPPQGGYSSVSLTPEQRAAWLAGMPQVRLYSFRETDTVRDGEGYGDTNGLVDDDELATAAGVDTAPLFYGERAFLHRNGVETPLSMASVDGSTFQILMPGVQSDAAVADGDSMSYMLPSDDAFNGFLTVTLDPENAYRFGGLDITPVRPTLTPIDVRYEYVEEPTEAGSDDFFSGASALCDGDAYSGLDDAPLHVYRRIHLLDPSLPVPQFEGGVIADDLLLGLPPHTGLLLIDVSEPGIPDAAVADLSLGFAIGEDRKKLDRAVEAIRRAQGDTDVFVIDTEIFSPLTFGDRPRLDGSFTFGQMISRI